jgi:hypothetical protein
MEWIDVNKELPTLGQYIIGTDGHHVGECVFAPRETFIPYNHYHIETWTKITFWIPLPLPPKG